MEGIDKIDFMEIVFKEMRYRLLVFVGCLGSRLSDFLGLGNKLENETMLSEKPDLNRWIWLGRSWGYLGPLKK